MQEPLRGFRLYSLAFVGWTFTCALTLSLEMNTALAGRYVFARQIENTQWLIYICAAFFALWVALLAHYRARIPNIEGMSRLMWTVIPLAILFLGIHANHVWLPSLLGSDGLSIYQTLRKEMPHFLMVGMYGLGIMALALCLEQSLLIASRACGVRRARTLRFVQIGSLIIVAFFFINTMNGSGHFIVGKGLFWRNAETSITSDAGNSLP